MKIYYLLSKNDYKKSSLEILKKRYFWGIILYLILSILSSYSSVYKNFDFGRFLILSFYYFSFFLITFLLIPDLIKEYRIQKNVKNQPNIFEPKYLEIKENGIELSNIENSNTKHFEWNTIKKIMETNNYNYIVFKDKTSIILKKADTEKTEFIEKIKTQLEKKYAT